MRSILDTESLNLHTGKQNKGTDQNKIKEDVYESIINILKKNIIGLPSFNLDYNMHTKLLNIIRFLIV